LDCQHSGRGNKKGIGRSPDQFFRCGKKWSGNETKAEEGEAEGEEAEGEEADGERQRGERQRGEDGERGGRGCGAGPGCRGRIQGIGGGGGRGRGGGSGPSTSTLPWRAASPTTDAAPAAPSFTATAGPHLRLQAYPQPIDFLDQFLDKEILGLIVG